MLSRRQLLQVSAWACGRGAVVVDKAIACTKGDRVTGLGVQKGGVPSTGQCAAVGNGSFSS